MSEFDVLEKVLSTRPLTCAEPYLPFSWPILKASICDTLLFMSSFLRTCREILISLVAKERFHRPPPCGLACSKKDNKKGYLDIDIHFPRAR